VRILTPSDNRRDFEVLDERAPDCEPADPANTVTNRLNNLLKNNGDGYVLRLCPNQVYLIQAPIHYAHPNQEISTVGYPTDNSRAVLSVSGPVANGEGHTTAVDGTCGTCDGVKLRNVQVCELSLRYPLNSDNIVRRLTVHGEVEDPRRAEAILKWAVTIPSSSLNLLGRTIPEVGHVFTLRRVLSLVMVSSFRTTTLGRAVLRSSKSGRTGSALAARMPLSGIT